MKAYLFGYPVDHWPRWLVLVISASGIFICFLLHGIAHEHLVKSFQLKEVCFLTCIQFLGHSALSFPTGIKILTRKQQLKAPLLPYFATSIALALSMSLTNFAAVRLSYATGVLFKSSKLIPVMIGNVIFLKKVPKPFEVVSVILIVLGLIGVTLGDFRGKNKFDIPGLVSVSTALICGAVASNLEDKMMSQYGSSQDEVIAMIYTVGALIVGTMGLLNGELIKGIHRVYARPTACGWLLIFSGLGAFGIQFVYLTMKVFGSLITVMVTSLRKALTICLSFILFRDKVFTMWHGVSMAAIAAGMGLNIYQTTWHQEKRDFGYEDEQDLLKRPTEEIIGQAPMT
jgi:adenosine 3'-phospho 5'-phosphosulfate transporter B3